MPPHPKIFYIRWSLSILIALAAVSPTLAQSSSSSSSSEDAALIVTASAANERVRFTGSQMVVQMRLEVLSDSGQVFFDAQSKGNVLDWSVEDGAGQRLAEGTYLCVVTVKSLSGHLRQRTGSLQISNGQLNLQRLEASEMTPAQQRTVGPVESDSSISVSAQDWNSPIQTIAHNDTVEEQADKATPMNTIGGENIAGAGTQNKVAKWTDNVGTLGDSAITEVGGNVGIGTNNPGGPLHIFGTATQDIFAGMGPDLTIGPAFNFGYAASSFGRGAGFFNVRPDAQAVAPNPSLRFATANVQRMIITNTGNVGIGNLGPTFKLHVVDSANTGLRVQTNTGGGTVASFGGNGDFLIDAVNIPGGRLTVKESGDVGIGLPVNGTPQAKLDVRGNVRIQNGSTLYLMSTPEEAVQGSSGIVPLCLSESLGDFGEVLRCPTSSSFRYKTNIRPFAGGLELINRLRPITFTWKKYGFQDVGFGAEEVEKVAPLLTFRNAKGEIEGVKYDRLSVLFVNAFKEQQAEINKEQQAIRQLKEELWRLHAASRRLRQRRHR